MEKELFQTITLLNTRRPDANVADIFKTLVSISLNGSPSVAARAKLLLRERFNTQVDAVCSF